MKKQAFSIIELIIVITILVLLAIVSMTVFNKRSDESQNTRVVADMNTIKASLVSYRAEESGLILPS
ncbi:MAG: prepilin-type N-terminal cleavage/methylation domain-containing protein [Candidatus Peribacteria bacterium]|jgi:prepilin-type N-terminal cleavage/methylation domain-containing protein|nr:prepilin-type N-terminal cleavage/methylation domain-containing protein [Candidatus Peribacteria bacterium]